MRGWRFGFHPLRAPGSPSPRASSRTLRMLGVVMATTVLLSACGAKEQIVYIDHEEESHGAYTPIGRSTSPRVHKEGSHHPADDVQIGSGHDAPYAPIGASGGALVNAKGAARTLAPILLAHERKAGESESYASPVSTPNAAPAQAGTVAQAGATAKAAASPTPPAHLSLRAGMGATVGPSTAGNALLIAQEGDVEVATVSGRVESIVGKMMTVQTPTGPARVTLADGLRVERDALGTPADLKPGQFVGAVQTPGGPASSIRLYATGPSTPRAGVVPMVGSRIGQVTTFGAVVTLQFGGVLLNTGGETTAVTLPAGVEILKPAPSDTSALGVGASVIAMGTVAGDGILAATATRITGSAPPPR